MPFQLYCHRYCFICDIIYDFSQAIFPFNVVVCDTAVRSYATFELSCALCCAKLVTERKSTDCEREVTQ